MTVASGAQAGTSPFQISWPPVKRLNRNALLVVAGLGAVTAFVAVELMAPTRAAGDPRGTERAADVAAPIQRQRPALPPLRPVAAVRDTAAVVPPVTAWDRAQIAQRAHATRRVAGDGHGGALRDPGEEAYRRALTSGLMVGERREAGGGEGRETVADGAQGASGRDFVETRSANGGRQEGVGPVVTPAPAPTGHERAAEAEQAEFLGSADHRVTGPVGESVPAAGSSYALVAGTIIPAELVTAVNSDLAGEIVGQVSRDVYDSRTESVVLIPRGARLIGKYDDRIVTGQSRVLVAWTRVLFPDGRSIALPTIEGVDATGAAGVAGDIDNHLGKVFERAAMMSALSVGAQLSQPTQSGTAYAAPSTGQVAAGAVGQELSEVGLEMVRQGLSVKPTITVRAGATVNVMLTQDLVFAGPYAGSGP